MGFWSNLLIDGGIGAASGAAGISPTATNKIYQRYRRKGSQEPNNIAPTYNEQNPGNPYSVPMFRNGGDLGPGQTGIVGDGTDDPRAEEVVNVAPDGSGVSIAPIMPPSDVRASAPDIDSNKPLPNVLSSVFGDLADNGGIAPQAQAGAATPGAAVDPNALAGAPSPGTAPVISPDAVASDAPDPSFTQGTVAPVSYGDRFRALDGMSNDPSQQVSSGTSRLDPTGLQGAADNATPVSTPTPLPKVEDDPNLLRRQQRLMTDGATPSHWYERLGMGALRGLAKGGLGGAIGGATVGVIGKGLYDQNKTQRELGQTNEEIKAQNANQKASYDAQKAGAEYQHQLIQNQLGIDEVGYNKLIHDPQWMIAQQTKKISPAQAEYLSTLVGKPVTASEWQTYVEKTDPATGKGLIRGEFNPRYGVNPTISPDATVPPVSINAGGIPLTLKQPEVGNLIATEAQANATRAQGAAIHNSTQALETAKANLGAQQTYNGQILKNRSDVIAQLGNGLENAGEVTGLGGQLQTANDRMQRAAAGIQYDANGAMVNSPENDKALKEFNDAQKDFGTVQTKLDAALGKTNKGTQMLTQLQNVESQIQKPGKLTATPVTPVQTQTITPATGKLTPTQVKKAAQDHGISYSEALKKAKAQGWQIQ